MFVRSEYLARLSISESNHAVFLVQLGFTIKMP